MPQTRLEAETEETSRKVLHARHEMEAREIDKLVDRVVQEISSAFLFAASNTRLVLQGAAVLLLAILAVVVVFEAATLTRSVFFQVSKHNLPLRTHPARHADGSWVERAIRLLHRQGVAGASPAAALAAAPSKLEQVVLQDALRATFLRTCNGLRAAALHGVALPHILVRGEAVRAFCASLLHVRRASLHACAMC